MMNLTPTEVTQLPYLLGHHPADAQGNTKALNWKDVPVGTAYVLMFAGLVQKLNGYQGQSFVSGEALYIPDTVVDMTDISKQGMPVLLPMNSVLISSVVKDKTIKVGSVYRITYIGRANAKGIAVNYDNFKIEAYNNKDLDAIAQAKWNESQKPLELGVNYSIVVDPVNKGDLLVVNGATPTQPASTPAQPVQPTPAVATAPTPAPAHTPAVATVPVVPAPATAPSVATAPPIAPALTPQ